MYMKFLERNLEDIICTSDRKVLKERGLNIQGKMFRQLRIGNYGIADVVTVTKPIYDDMYKGFLKGLITVYELKQNKIGVEAFLQALSYVQGISNYIEKRDICGSYDFRIVLIGSEINTSSNFCFLRNFLINDMDSFDCYHPILSLEKFTYHYDVDGISFKSHYGYKLVDEGF